MSRLAPAPLAPLELMRAALHLFYTSFTRALPYALLPMVLLFALLGTGYLLGEAGYLGQAWALYLIGAFLLLCPALMAPLVVQVHASAHGRSASAGEALRRGLRSFLPCLAGAALFMLAVGTGSLMLIVPGTYLFIALSFWWIALVVDGLPVIKALTGSLRLVRGHWWHVAFGFSYVYPVVFCVNAFDVNMVSLSNRMVEAVVATLIAVVLCALVPMFVSANMVVIYHDLTLRRRTKMR
ncbi:hypothetical protein F2P45_11950 [Massilia sp. CCM 8733]|uniref:Uncharacterized protein n=1 Tax=Massilia mucilaginosa TaxID=2609282 RepID=A0ABX0NS50_9BURK|nr:hypothetical protein [Massilia mucilaginosa]NHZ89718.1 hypothetical protein [Massilia mucilaginosa]